MGALANYTLAIFQASTHEVDIVNDALTFEDTYDRQLKVYRRRLTNEIILEGSAYDSLVSARLWINLFGEVFVAIRLNGTNVYFGFLSFGTGQIEWDEDNKIARFKVDPRDDYSLLVDGWETPFNIFTGTTAKTLQLFYGSTETNVCSVTETADYNIVKLVDSCLTYPKAWYLSSHVESRDGTNVGRDTTWIREKITSSPPSNSGDWVDIGSGDYARPAFALSNTYLGSLQTYLRNGILLNEILEDFAPGSYTIKSDFFGINADATAPSNTAYTAAGNRLGDLLVFQKSDVKKWGATNVATIGELTYKDLLTTLKVLFNVEFAVTDSGATLRIEHASYFESQTQGLDLTAATYADYVKQKQKHSFSQDGNTKSEYWQYYEETFEDFKGPLIEYPFAPLNSPERTDHVPAEFNNDLRAIWDDEKTTADLGFCIVAPFVDSGTYYLTWDFNDDDSEMYPNGYMAFPNLIPIYHYWQRPYDKGDVDFTTVSFNSAQKRKEQQEIAIEYSDSNYFNNFDPAESVKTVYGWGKVVRAVYEAHNQVLKLTIRHDA